MVKKFLTIVSVLAVGFFLTTNCFALNAASMQGGNPDNWYIEVEFNQTGTAGSIQYTPPAHGMVVEWDLDSDTGETLGVTVATCDTADEETVAGVVPAWDDVAHNLRTTLADGDKFLIQIRGYHSGLCTDGNAQEGNSLASKANGVAGDGDGLGFAFIDDASNDSTNAECGYGGTFSKAWIDFDR